MKRIFLAALCATSLSTSAIAADSIDAPAAAGYSWSGVYGGIFGAWAGFDSTATDISGEEFGGATPGAQEDASGDGFLGGLTLGYNFQNGNWVYGPEFEIGAIHGDALDVVNTDDGVLVEYDGLYASIAGRIGYASGQTLIYGKAGVAFANILNLAGEFDGVGNEGGGGFLGFDGDEAGFGDDIRHGFTIGGGVEYAFTANWSVKAEYAHIRFDDATYNTFVSDIQPFAFEDTLHVVKFGLNYKF